MTHALRRRDLLALAGAAGVGTVAGCAGVAGGAAARPHVVVVGGGYGGATAAKHLRLWSQGKIGVTLIEPDPSFVSCPMSNLVVAGQRTMDDITRPYDALAARHGVRLVHDTVVRIDTVRRTVALASGAGLDYDKLVLAPGVEMIWDEVAGLREASGQGRVLQAWKAGPQTLALRRQLEAMPDGGVFAIAIPQAPYRCPPAPYERATLIANWFKTAKPRAKVLILDANEDVTSKGALFKRAWAESYAGRLEYRPQHKTTGVDGAGTTLSFEIQDDVRADVLNVLPPMRAGAIAVTTGLANANARWCNVDYLTFESTVARHVHVIGDAIQIAPFMPKSGHMANSHAKVVAAALVAELNGWEVDPAPMLSNACYSFVDDRRVVHVTSVHAYQPAEKTYRPVPGSGGLSPAPSATEAAFAYDWARAIWADTLG
jgi:NADPH-dependent 2,4-dienoyl-CoA reductase/sulfur reductase-like enzyme